MAAKRKVSITTGPTNHRQSSSERHAAYVAQIANRQTELKNEAAARRAKRAAEATGDPETAVEAPPEATTDNP